MSSIKLNNFKIGNIEPMTLIGGVNVLESDSIVMNVAEKFADSAGNLNINWIFSHEIFDIKMNNIFFTLSSYISITYKT